MNFFFSAFINNQHHMRNVLSEKISTKNRSHFRNFSEKEFRAKLTTA